MADVTIYGTLSGGLEHDTYNSGMPSQNKVDDYTSIIGFKGSEDLGNGLKTVWQIENRVHLDGTGSSDTFATRQTFVGLDGGNIGLIRMGHLNTAENDQYSVDQWSDNSGVNGLQLFDSGNRLNNAIRYDSATFAGFSGVIGYGFGENATSGVSASDVLTYGVNYNTPMDGLVLHYAGNYDRNPTKTSDGRRANNNLLEADYNQGNLFLSTAYQWATGYDLGNATAINDTAAAQGLKTRQIALSAAYSFGAIKPKISFAKGWNGTVGDSTISDSGYTQYVVGVDYALSKRTTVGISYGHMSQGANIGQTEGYVVPVSTTSVQMSTSF
jgi:predicted porin